MFAPIVLDVEINIRMIDMSKMYLNYIDMKKHLHPRISLLVLALDLPEHF